MRIESTEASGKILRHPAVPYVVPFILFLALLALGRYVPARLLEISSAVGFFVVFGVTLFCSRRIITWRLMNFWGSTALGVVLFAIWVGPDVLWPAYR